MTTSADLRLMFVFFIYCMLLFSLATTHRIEGVKNKIKDTFLEKYGTDWVLFPDDHGYLHFVNISRVDNVPFSLNDDEDKIYFQLYTRKNPSQFEQLIIGVNENCNEIRNKKSTNYDPNNSLKVLIHGWQSNGQAETILAMKDAYLNKSDVNVMVVDWGEIAGRYNYVAVAGKTDYVGEKTGKMIESLMKRHCFEGEVVHLVGHSLGAHISGYAGRYLVEQNREVARITGLDPARPLFEIPFTSGLRSTDASFVDIIHTNAGVLGIKNPRGHADFFPNGGGREQPGCDESETLPDACAHTRSFLYFIESITDGGFSSVPCEGWPEYVEGTCQSTGPRVAMGQRCPQSASGQYYLRTNDAPKFSQDEKIVTAIKKKVKSVHDNATKTL